MTDFQDQPKTATASANSPAEPKSGDFRIERPDWTLFRSLSTLGQKAGVHAVNAMTTPQFLEWMEEKMEAHGVGKVVPPQAVIIDEAEVRLEAKLRKRIGESHLLLSHLLLLLALAFLNSAFASAVLPRAFKIRARSA